MSFFNSNFWKIISLHDRKKEWVWVAIGKSILNISILYFFFASLTTQIWHRVGEVSGKNVENVWLKNPYFCYEKVTYTFIYNKDFMDLFFPHKIPNVPKFTVSSPTFQGFPRLSFLNSRIFLYLYLLLMCWSPIPYNTQTGRHPNKIVNLLSCYCRCVGYIN